MRVKDKTFKVLILEPYYGGSHKAFISRLKKLPFRFKLMTFPARKWKWRMRLAAPFYALKLHETGERFDRIICSTYVDVAAFRGLAPSWVQKAPLLTYFHENQFAYPMQIENERDLHFGITNMTTALASDSLAFNSRYNLDSFLNGIKKFQKQSYDLKLDNPCNAIRKKSRLLPPGIDFSAIDSAKRDFNSNEPVIIWNHRWEHDKNPDDFFDSLFKLDNNGINFKLIVLGQSFKSQPAIFERARQRLSGRVLNFAYVESRQEYAEWLRRGDIVISTARHEFFGISIIEAVRAGCRPLLPKRLSYPEIFPEEFLYDDKDFTYKLEEALLTRRCLSHVVSKELTEPFSWNALAPGYISWIMGAETQNSKETE